MSTDISVEYFAKIRKEYLDSVEKIQDYIAAVHAAVANFDLPASAGEAVDLIDESERFSEIHLEPIFIRVYNDDRLIRTGEDWADDSAPESEFLDDHVRMIITRERLGPAYIAQLRKMNAAKAQAMRETYDEWTAERQAAQEIKLEDTFPKRMPENEWNEAEQKREFLKSRHLEWFTAQSNGIPYIPKGDAYDQLVEKELEKVQKRNEYAREKELRMPISLRKKYMEKYQQLMNE